MARNLRIAACNTAAEQAAHWFARQRSAPLSSVQAKQFAQWMRSDPSNAAAWESCCRLWGRLDAVRDDPRMLVLREGIRSRTIHSPLARPLWKAGVAAALALMAVAGWWIFRGTPELVVAHLKISHPTDDSPLDEQDHRGASTLAGQRSLLFLPDGSRVTLNSASTVRANYSHGERKVTLVKGQAFFEVAKDPSRPFVVTAGSRQVVAVGTAFDVKVDGQRLDVTLVQGKVRVEAPVGVETSSPAPAMVNLDAGSALRVQPDQPDRVEQVDTARVTRWRTGQVVSLIFDEERLANVVAELNRHSDEQIVIATAALGERRVSGVFASGAARTATRALEAYGLVRATETSPGVIVLSDR